MLTLDLALIQNTSANELPSIRLAAHLYAEQLLDRDHYTDWLVSGLESSPHSKLPMWILIAQIHWDDMLRLRKNARRLVTALLSHLNTVGAILLVVLWEFSLTSSSRFTATLIETSSCNSLHD